ncbi:MAG TPA: 6,7-dimethyl-8-ribityllumazine synthase [Gaiellaceae bacterium]|nr:6,7-dimethyl-8-ribityllumazine synthase [Gaiellaceae bacterium]
MSARESWPGEKPDVTDVDETDEEAGEAYGDDEDTGGDEPVAELRIAGHEGGELEIPDDVDALEGEPRGTRRPVGIVVARADVEVANRLLDSALAELERAGVGRDHVLVMAVPGAFELPIGAMALAKTRRYACIVALGSAVGSAVVAGESASGLQLAGLETGVPVAFGVLTDAGEDADGRGAEAVRHALEMADLFQQLRVAAKTA